MSTAKDLKAALFYLQSECYRAGFAETGYLVEVARLSLENARHPRRAEAPAPAPAQAQAQAEQGDDMVRLRA